MRGHFVTALGCTLLLSAVSGASERNSGCLFSINPEPQPPQILGSPEVPGGAWVMAQPDSPLAIIRADLSGIDIAATTGSFTRASSRHVLDVKNVSDQVVADARVAVRIAFGPRSGIGSGAKLGRPLQPGEHARIEWTSGAGRGSDNAREVSIVALVEEVTTPGCLYKPSQAWPARTETQQTPSR